MSTAIANGTPAKDIKSILNSDAMKQQIARALPEHCKADRMLRVTTTALTKTPKLLNCTQESFFGALLQLSQWGLEPDGRRAHLIPYGNQCQLIIDYKGLVELAWNSGKVASIHADVVCENDEFVEDAGEVKIHRIDRRKRRGEMYAAYAKVKLITGAEKHEVMSKDEIDAIRARSKSGHSGPWVTDYNEMAKKTVFRRLTKWLPLSAEIREAAYGDDDVIDTTARTVTKPAASLESLTDTLALEHDDTLDVPTREPGEEG